MNMDIKPGSTFNKYIFNNYQLPGILIFGEHSQVTWCLCIQWGEVCRGAPGVRAGHQAPWRAWRPQQGLALGSVLQAASCPPAVLFSPRSTEHGPRLPPKKHPQLQALGADFRYDWWRGSPFTKECLGNLFRGCLNSNCVYITYSVKNW